MMTNTTATTSTTSTTSTIGATTAPDITTSPVSQKVVIVNGSPDVMALVDTVLGTGRYDIVFVESSARAYSHIKRLQPHLVILCMRIEEREGFQVLSMLKLDEETRRIPVLTYTTEYEGQETDDEGVDASDMDLFIAPPRAWPMN